MILAASVALVSADTKTKYPPYEDAWGDKYGEKNGGLVFTLMHPDQQ